MLSAARSHLQAPTCRLRTSNIGINFLRHTLRWSYQSCFVRFLLCYQVPCQMMQLPTAFHAQIEDKCCLPQDGTAPQGTAMLGNESCVRQVLVPGNLKCFW